MTFCTRSRPVCATLALLALLCLAGCTTEEAASADAAAPHVVERTTQGDVTTVRNVAGSVWGGNASLEVELEIGIHEGDERYMLSGRYPLFATDDEIYVAESRDGKIRVYGFDGVHRRDFGKPGPGPGELGGIQNLDVTEDGRVLITHMGQEGGMKVSIFTTAGEFLEEWHIAAMGGGGVGIMPGNVVRTPQGMQTIVYEQPTEPTAMMNMRFGFQMIGKDGLEGEPWMVPESDYEPATYTVSMQGFSYETPVPYEPTRSATAITRSGHRVWGHPHEYRFHIENPDGTTTVVERVTDPVEVSAEEADYTRRGVVHSMRQRDPDFDWDGSGMPTTKPWYVMFVTDQLDRIWVSRQGPSRRIEDCTQPEDRVRGERWTPCWEPTRLLEAFDTEGNFLGGLDRPEGLVLLGPYVRGDIMVAGYEDEMGVPMVRVYRLVMPGQDLVTDAAR